MKIWIMALLVLVSCSSPKTETISQLIPLKPVKVTITKKLGILQAGLYDEKGQMIIEQMGVIGDCQSCIRGFSVQELIGVRIEGKSANNFTIGRKQDPSVEIVDCSQREFVNKKYNCRFKINKVMYELRFSI